MAKIFAAIGILTAFLALGPLLAPPAAERSIGGNLLGGPSTITEPGLSPSPDFGRVPLYFIANRGQMSSPALFYARTARYTLWLTKDGLVFDAARPLPRDPKPEARHALAKLVFKGAQEPAGIVPDDPAGYRVSYFYGRCPEDWRTDVPTCRSVLYKELYPGIDLKLYGLGGEVEYDWVVRPDANPRAIALSFEGAREAAVDARGDLVVRTDLDEIRHKKPRSYQEIGGRRVEVEADFECRGGPDFGFRVGNYDRSHPLIIDPYILAGSTYLGGRGPDAGWRIAVDPAGAVYIIGNTFSADFPTATASQHSGSASYDRLDVFITKLSPDGRSLIYSAFFPQGNVQEFSAGLALGTDGSMYLASGTTSNKFPIRKPFQKRYGGGQFDAFVLKLAPDGQSLSYSSYLGGSGNEMATQIALDAKGTAFVVGYTSSRDFPLKNPYQKTLGGSDDAFLVKVSPDGASLLNATYLGGAHFDWGMDMALDAGGAPCVLGITYSTDFPVKKPYQAKFGGAVDIFLTKFSPDGRSLAFSTYLGGSWEDIGRALAIDGAGSMYIAGYSRGPFPVKKALQPNRKGSADAVVVKLAPDGQSLVYSTYLGGAGSDEASDIVVDADGSAFIAGQTESAGFPTKSAYQKAKKGRTDAFLTVLSPSGQSLPFSTFLGGLYHDYGEGIALGPKGRIYLTGFTNSPDFPVLSPYQKNLGGDFDGFITQFKPAASSRRARTD